MLHFENDYVAGCHPQLLKAIIDTNDEQTPGYGFDIHCKNAAELIKKECCNKDAEVWFLTGGTQVNSTVIDGLLSNYEGVIAADSGHIAVHEAGAIEASGHKVITLPEHNGKLSVNDVVAYIENFYADATHPHMVYPGAIYISHPTEYGSLYTSSELESLSRLCRQYNIPLFMDGARLGYALMSDHSDMSMKTIASMCDVFYIGGTKVGALLGEAVVISNPKLIPHFFTIIKQHGALLAKSRILGVQFEELFRDGLYYEISRHAVIEAQRIRDAFISKGYKPYSDSSTNQQFIIMANDKMDELSKHAKFEIWGHRGDKESVVRFVTSWATKSDDVTKLISLIP